jgi:hypothetical protein
MCQFAVPVLQQRRRNLPREILISSSETGDAGWLYVSRSGKTPAGFESQLRPIKMAASQFLIRIAPHLVTAGSVAEVESLVRQVETADASLGLGTDRDLDLIAAVHDEGRSRSERFWQGRSRSERVWQLNTSWALALSSTCPI